MTCIACDGVAWGRRVAGVADFEYGTPEFVDYVACRTCGLIAQDPLPDREAIPAFYPPDYRLHADADDSFARLKRWYLAYVARKLAVHIPPQGRILEIGCGNGELLRLLRRRGFRDLYGSDFVATGAERLRSAGIAFRCVDIEETFPFEGTFDAVIMNNVIEHFVDPVLVLRQVRDHLARAGVALLVTPDGDSCERRLFGRYWAGFHAPRHVHIFTRRSIDALRLRLGFAQVVVHSMFEPGQWALSVQNLCQNTPLLRTRLSRGLAWYTMALTGVLTPCAAIQTALRRGAGLFVTLSLGPKR